jgi:hypothetical protein
LEIAEAKVILAEICLLKERGLTAEAVVADFVFKYIQPLKDRAYPAYLYSGVTNSTWVSNKRIPAMDLVSRLEMILRGKVSNIGAPVAYSAWNLPPSKSFFDYVSNPPASDSGLGLRVRPSLEEVEVLVASLGDFPNDERQVHFEMPMSSGDTEISAMLDMLAGDSSDSVPVETMAIATIPEPEKTVDTRRPEGTRPKRLRQVSHPAAPAEGKKKRRLRRVSCLDCDAGPSIPAAEEVPVELFTRANPNGCVPAAADPTGVALLMLNSMGVALLMLIPMGVTLPKLIPMGVTLPELIPMGVTLTELIPMGGTLCRILSVLLTRMRKRKSP